MLDFADVGARVPAHEVEELVFVEYAGGFGQDKLRHVDIGVFVLRVDCSDGLAVQVIALLAPHVAL